MLFIILLILTTTSIAGAAAFFSVYGLAHTFSGTFWSVVWMGGSLEAGKLVAASFAYRFWSNINWALKSFLIVSVAVLMLLTSVGIFGYLSSGYQTDTLTFKQNDQQIILLEKEEKELQARKKEIDKQIAELPANFVRGRRQLIQSFESETSRINKRLPEITSEIQRLKTEQVKAEAHVGPIIYIAKVFEMPTDNATKWLIFLLIFVFDPLAVTLTICVNIALKLRKEESGNKSSDVGGAHASTDADEKSHAMSAGEDVKRTDGESPEIKPSVDNVSVPLTSMWKPNLNSVEYTGTAVMPPMKPIEIPPYDPKQPLEIDKEAFLNMTKPQQEVTKPLKFELVEEEEPKEEDPEWLERFKRRTSIVEDMRKGTLK